MTTRTVRDTLFTGPVPQAIFHLRYTILDGIHQRRTSPDQTRVLAALKALKAPLVAFTVAYNVPAAITLLSDAMARFMPDVPLVVCDNSDEPEAAAAIRAFCERAGRLYCAVPRGPLVKRRSARSHATALNWTVRNLIVPSGIRRFATLDHDLVPLGPDDMLGHLKDQPVYGYVRRSTRSSGWYLWPGYAMFDLDRIDAAKLDFGADRSLGLDTGGRMWTRLYRFMDKDAIKPAPEGAGRLPDVEKRFVHQVFDTWFHVGGVSYQQRPVDVIGALRALLERDPDHMLARVKLNGPESDA